MGLLSVGEWISCDYGSGFAGVSVVWDDEGRRTGELWGGVVIGWIERWVVNGTVESVRGTVYSVLMSIAARDRDDCQVLGGFYRSSAVTKA